MSFFFLLIHIKEKPQSEDWWSSILLMEGWCFYAMLIHFPSTPWWNDVRLEFHHGSTLSLAFELRCWRRLLRVRWTARRSNQSILKETSPEYSLEGLTLKLKFQYFGPMMQRTNSLEETLMLGKIEGSRRRGGQRMRWWDGSPTWWTWVWAGSWWWTGRPAMLQSLGSKSRAGLSDWTESFERLF